MKKFVTVLSFFLLSYSLSHAQNIQVNIVGKFIDSFVKKNDFNGTILIQKKGFTTYHKSFGLANRPFQVPMKLDTRFKIASITKLFTAVLIMQLQEQGKINVNKTIHVYLPGYTGEGGSKVTIHQLLNHTSGMVNMDTITSIESALKNGLAIYQHPYTSDDLLTKFSSDTLVTEPGTVFNYNNAEYIILGKIIEQVTGKSYEQVLKDQILCL